MRQLLRLMGSSFCIDDALEAIANGFHGYCGLIYPHICRRLIFQKRQALP